MQSALRLTVLIALTAIAGPAPAASQSGDDKPDELTYWKDIRPILQRNCTVCHSIRNIGKKEIGGGLALTTYDALTNDPQDPLLRPGSSAESRLVQVLVTEDDEKRMPKDADALENGEIELIRKWVDGGAKEGERPEDVTEVVAGPVMKRPSSLVRSFDIVLGTAAELTADSVKAVVPAVPPGKLELALKIGPLPPVTALAYGPNQKWLAAGSYGSTAIWNLETGALIKSIDAPGSVHAIAVHPEGGLLAAAGGLPARTGEVLVINTQSWQTVTVLGEHTDVVYDVAFSPDGKTVATASLDKTVRVWSTSDWKPIQVLKGHSDFVYSVAFTPDGKRLISSSKDRSIKVYNVESWESERTLSGHNEEVLATAVAADSNTVVSAGKEPQLRWWNIENGQIARTVPGHSGTVNQIVFSGDGKRVASVGQDKQVRIWDSAEGKLSRAIAGATEWLYSVALSPDGKRVAAGSWDGLVRIWDADSGRLLATMIAPPSPEPDKPQWIVMTPEGFFQASDELANVARWQSGGKHLSGEILHKLRQTESVERALRGESVDKPSLQ